MTIEQKKRQDKTFEAMRANAKTAEERMAVEIKISKMLKSQTRILTKKIKA